MKLILTLPILVIAIMLYIIVLLLQLLHFLFIVVPCFIVTLLYLAIKYLRGDTL